MGAAACASQWGGPRKVRERGGEVGLVREVLAVVRAEVARWVVEGAWAKVVARVVADSVAGA